MRTGLFGFGKTGRAVASVLLESRKTNLQWVIRQRRLLTHRSVPEFLGVESDEPGLIYALDEFTPAQLFDRFPVDVIIDFSSSSGIDFYGPEAARRGIAIISAVSSYDEERMQLLQELGQQTRVIWSPNITLGINFLLLAARILQKIAPQADIEIVEEHFKGKPEVSGTARKLAAGLGLDAASIKSIRAGGIIGVHEVLFGFPYQTVRLRHESIAREAFGNGVLFAACNILDKPVGLYSMEDIMRPYFNLPEQEAG